MATLNELMTQRAEIDAQIAAHKREMVTQVLAIMQTLGVTLADIGLVVNPPTAPVKRPIKYRDDKGNTWTGVGQRPRWLQARILAGASLDDFRAR